MKNKELILDDSSLDKDTAYIEKIVKERKKKQVSKPKK